MDATSLELSARHGDSHWSIKGGWGSLTKRPKLCGADEAEIAREAARRGATLTRCQDCM